MLQSHKLVNQKPGDQEAKEEEDPHSNYTKSAPLKPSVHSMLI